MDTSIYTMIYVYYTHSVLLRTGELASYIGQQSEQRPQVPTERLSID